MNIEQYSYRVIWSEDDNEFVGLCSEFPSLSWLENDQTAAFSGIVNLVRDTVSDMESSGEAIPQPLSLHKYSGKFIVRTTPELHRRLAIQAMESKVSLNRLINSRLLEHD